VSAAPEAAYRAISAGDAAITLPRVVHEQRPQYTREAMRRRIQGAVLVEAMVDADGKVSNAKVIRSLDPEFGLDREALAAAKKWRFTPGTRDGRPVPVLVMIELAFTLDSRR
jgi:protein TonB